MNQSPIPFDLNKGETYESTGANLKAFQYDLELK